MRRTIGVLAVGAACAILALLGALPSAHPGRAAGPAPADPFHHLSGVVLYAPGSTQPGRGLPAGAGPLLPSSFGPNVSAVNGDPSAQNETTIAIAPDDPNTVIASANDYRCGLCAYVYRSTDGGSTWVNTPVPGATGLSYGDPAMAFGSGGFATFGYLGYTSLCSPTGGMYVSTSTDAGATFTAPYRLAANTNNGAVVRFQDKDYVAVDAMPGSPSAGTAYETWTNFGFAAGPNCGDVSSQFDASVVLSRSTDHGISWSVPITVSPPISNNNQGAIPAVGRHGEVYVYYLGAQTQSQLNYDTVLFSRSTDGGQTFPFFTHIASVVDLPSPLPHTSFRDNAFGAIAVDQQLDGYLYAVWADYRTGDADILFSRSTDNGTTWGAPLRVNDDPLGNGKDQFFPWIATSPDGRVHVAWFDRRDDPNDVTYREYYANSTDHGASFEANVAVSDVPSNPGASGFIGDYSGLAATTGLAIPVWTDIRAGSNQDAYVARGTYLPDQTPTPTATPGVPTATPVPPTATPAPPTATPAPPSATPVPSATPALPTATAPPPTDTPAPTGTPPPSATPSATATPGCIFVDVCPGDYFYDAVRYLLSGEVITGYADGSFRPYNPTTRGQMAKIAILGFDRPIVTPPGGTYTFADVPRGFPFFDVIETAAHDNIVSGYNCGGPGEPCDTRNRPYFRPYANVTRGQLSKIIILTAGWPAINPAESDLRRRIARQHLLPLRGVRRLRGRGQRLHLRRPRRALRPAEPPLLPPVSHGRPRPDRQDRLSRQHFAPARLRPDAAVIWSRSRSRRG